LRGQAWRAIGILRGNQPVTKPASRQTARVTHRQKGRPPREEAGARRLERSQELMRAAAIALSRRGVSGTSMEALSDDLGIPKSVLYRYFDSKDKLVRAILDQILLRWTELQKRPWQGLDANLRDVLALARSNPCEFLLLARHSALDPDLRPYFDRLHTSIVGRTERLISASGASLAKDAVMRQLCAQSVAGFLLEAVLWWIEHGRPDRDDDFLTWARQSLDTLYRRWMPDADWRAQSVRDRLA
jgi:AcrR family transcriptional regulator